MKNKMSVLLSSRLKQAIFRLAAVLVLLVNTACHASAIHGAKKENGLMLDIARHFYTAEIIKKYIDTVADAGGGFVHLHVSDDENYALESGVLNQKAKDAEFSDGIYKNRVTGRPFLSDVQLREIVEHAEARGVALIPEVGSPNHMGMVFRLLEQYKGAGYAASLKSKTADDEIDITNPQSIAFVESLIKEVAGKFKYSRRFHIGGDEFGYSLENNHEFVAYANRLAAFVERQGMTAQIWNDGLIRQTFKDLSRKIEVTYWSYDGDAQDGGVRKERRRIRASMPDLIDNGFKVWNYNSYYLYFVPRSSQAVLADDARYAVTDIEKRWHLGIWDGRNADNAVRNTEKIQGAALAIWGEHAGKLESEVIFQKTHGLLRAVLDKAAVSGKNGAERERSN